MTRRIILDKSVGGYKITRHTLFTAIGKMGEDEELIDFQEESGYDDNDQHFHYKFLVVKSTKGQHDD